MNTKLRTSVIILTLAAVLFIGTALLISMNSLDKNIENRALNELKASTQSQTLFLAHSVEQQYTSLEALAAYLAVQNAPADSFLESKELTDAAVLTNGLCMLGYSGLDGNAFSYDGRDLGNISDRQYFKDAIAPAGGHSVEYLESTAQSSDPRILFGVPVVKDNATVGIIFAAKEPDIFKDAMFSESFDGKKLTVLTDANGRVIIVNGNSDGRFETGGLFDEYSTDIMTEQDTRANVLADMQSSQPGHFCTESEYVSYIPLGVGDWYVFGAVDKDAVLEAYKTNIQSYRQIIILFALSFAAFVALLVFLTAVYSRKRKQDIKLLRQQYERVHVIMRELNSAFFSYDTAAEKLTVSDNYVNLFGKMPPVDWVSHLEEKAASRSETDYKALIKAKKEVEQTGNGTQVVLQAYNKDKVLRWFRIILAPHYDENKRLNSICGFIIDVTKRHDEFQGMMMEKDRLMLAVNNLASLVMSCNLTRNTFRMINYDDFTTKAAPYEGSFDELIAIGASTVPEDDRQHFIDAFSRKNLLAAHKRGETRVELEHRQVGDDGIVRWIRTCVLFVNNQYDDDVYEITFSRDITESKKYHITLQRAFDLTLENMPSFVGKWMFKDGDVILIYANKRYLEFLGTTEEAVLGKSIYRGLNNRDSNKRGDEKNDIITKFYECERQRKPINSITRGWKMNGEKYWLKVQASFFEEEDGHSVYYGTVTDITEQITAQQKLTEAVAELKRAYAQVTSVNVYRSLMDYSHSGGMLVRTLWSSEHKYLFISPGLLNTCGCSEEEFKENIENGRSSFIHPDDSQSVAEANKKLIDLGDSATLNYRLRHKDGHYMWVVEHAIVAAMPNGEKVIAGITVDVSEQKKLEEKLRVSQEEYKVAASLSSSAVLSFDIESRSYEVISNKDEAHDFARAKHDVPEYAISIGAVAPESAGVLREIFSAIDKGEKHEKSIIALCSSTGVKYWMELSYTILFNNSGKPMTAILLFDDVTAKINAEAMFNISSTFLNYSKKATKLVVVDLTTRTVRYETDGAHGLLSKVSNTKKSAEAVKYFISRMVVPEDRDACTEFFSAKHYLESYANGVTEESFEYRGYTLDNVPHWYNAQTRLIEDTYTHDIILYLVLSDIDEQKLTELDLMRRAQTDSLTGLLNRESFDAQLQACCDNPKNKDCGLFNAIVMIDIDKFKSINDTFGHNAGDEALRQFAKRIKENLRGNDIVARFGGDEFIVQLPRMPSVEMIEQRCAKICEALNFKLENDYTVSGSIGIAVCPVDGCKFSELLKKADSAMYRAKKSGGNRCLRYTEDTVHQVVSESKDSAINTRTKKVFARTFGYFDLLIDGVPLHFDDSKEKELLAILIDRNGATLSAGDAISILWKNEPAGDRLSISYRKLAMGLKHTLEEAGVDKIMIFTRTVNSIDTNKLECDYYQFLKGDPKFRKLYRGYYMTNYGWSAKTASKLNRML